MKSFLLFATLLFVSFSFAQKKPGNVKIIVDEKKLNAIESDLEEIERSDSLNCNDMNTQVAGYVFYLTSFDPWGTSEAQIKALAEFDARLLELSKVYDCIKGKIIYLKLSESLLLSDKERKKAYTEDWNVDEKIHEKHLKLFIEKYSSFCETNFPGATIYVEEYLW